MAADSALQLDTASVPAGGAALALRAGGVRVPAVSRAVAVLNLLARAREPMSLARLSAQLHLPKSSVHGLCSTLFASGYLRREVDGGYFIGPGVMGLAHAFAAHTSPAQEFARLWADAPTPPQETVILSVLDGTDVVYLAAHNGVRPLGLAFTVGMRLPACRAATGKAILAFSRHDRVAALFPHDPMPPFLDRAVLRRDAWLAELDRVRACGYSIDDQGVREGVYCFGAPVFDATGEVVAGVGMCLQKATLNAEVAQQQRNTVLSTARELSRRLGAVEPNAVAVP